MWTRTSFQVHWSGRDGIPSYQEVWVNSSQLKVEYYVRIPNVSILGIFRAISSLGQHPAKVLSRKVWSVHAGLLCPIVTDRIDRSMSKHMLPFSRNCLFLLCLSLGWDHRTKRFHHGLNRRKRIFTEVMDSDGFEESRKELWTLRDRVLVLPLCSKDTTFVSIWVPPHYSGTPIQAEW